MGAGTVELSAHDLAREIRRRVPCAGLAQVHKWLYYCQGWHLAWRQQPLFAEDIQAWTNGPVVADLWRDERYGPAPPPASDLTTDAKATVATVLDRYGHLTGVALIRLTHGEAPWRTASESVWPNETITQDALRSFFGESPDTSETLARLRATKHALEYAASEDGNVALKRLAERIADGPHEVLLDAGGLAAKLGVAG